MVAHTRSQVVEAGGPEGQGHLQLRVESEASLGCMKPSLKKKKYRAGGGGARL